MKITDVSIDQAIGWAWTVNASIDVDGKIIKLSSKYDRPQMEYHLRSELGFDSRMDQIIDLFNGVVNDKALEVIEYADYHLDESKKQKYMKVDARFLDYEIVDTMVNITARYNGEEITIKLSSPAICNNSMDELIAYTEQFFEFDMDIVPAWTYESLMSWEKTVKNILNDKSFRKSVIKSALASLDNDDLYKYIKMSDLKKINE